LKKRKPWIYLLGLGLLIILVMVLARIPSQGKPAGAAPAVVTVWYSVENKEEQELLKQFDSINKTRSDVMVKGIKVPAAGFAERVWNLQAGGQGPELFIAQAPILFDLYQKGAVSPFLADTSRFYRGPLSVYTFNRQPFAAPLLTDVPLLYFRKDSITLSPADLTEVLAKNQVAIKSLDFALLSPWWEAEGGILSQGGIPALDSPLNVGFLNKIAALRSGKRLLVDPQAIQLFTSGKVNYLIAWASDSPALEAAKINWGCVALSSVAVNGEGIYRNNGIGIANSSIKTVPAMETAIRQVEEELLKTVVLEAFHQTTGYLPAVSDYYQGALPGEFRAAVATALLSSREVEGHSLDWKLIPLVEQAWKNIAAGANSAAELAQAQAAALESVK